MSAGARQTKGVCAMDEIVTDAWVSTAIEGVCVEWDADEKVARVHGPTENAESPRALLEACEAALDGTGVHVLLRAPDADDEAIALEEGCLVLGVDDTWTATHRLVFTPEGAAPEAPLYVMLLDDEDPDYDGRAFDRSEWRDEEGGSWCVADGPHGEGWYCEGNVTPGGASGSVEAEELPMCAWALYEDNAGGLWGRPAGEFVAYALEHGEPNRSGAFLTRAEYEHPECRMVARLDRDEVTERLCAGGAAARKLLGPYEQSN